MTCGTAFTLYLCELATGRIISTPPIVRANWSDVLSDVGTGSITLRQVELGSVWPHRTSVYITASTPQGELPVFGGMVEDVRTTASGEFELGVIGIEGYLGYRLITPDKEFGSKVVSDDGETTYITGTVPQTTIAAELAQLAIDDGVPLSVVDAGSAVTRYRFYDMASAKPILEALRELASVIDGVSWELTHTRSNNVWSTQIQFLDAVTRGEFTLEYPRDFAEFSMSVSGSEHANVLLGIGARRSVETDEGSVELPPIMAEATDLDGFYVRFESSVSWMDVSVMSTLVQHTEGALSQRSEPPVSTSVTLRGDSLPLDIARSGTLVHLTARTEYNAFDGDALTASVAWEIAPEGLKRTLELVPLGSSRDTVLFARLGGNNDRC